jgi:hypothetical protein
MINEIGDCAGKLWRYLEEHPSSTLEDVAKSLKEKEQILAMAAGWLAREDKLHFVADGKTHRLSVNSSS